MTISGSIPKSKYLYRTCFLLLAGIMGILASAADPHSPKSTTPYQTLRKAYDKAIARRDYKEALDVADSMCRSAAATRDSTLILTSIAKRMEAALATTGEVDLASDFTLLRDAYPAVKESGDSASCAAMARALGKYCHFVDNTFTASLQYYLDALNHDPVSRDASGRMKDLSALAVLYLHRNDSTGRIYAEEAYRLAAGCQDSAKMYIAACNMANYLLNENAVGEARTYLTTALRLADRLHYGMEQTYLHTMLASADMADQAYSKAEKEYRQAIAADSLASPYDRLYARIRFASFLHSRGATQEALRLVEETEDESREYGLDTFRLQILSVKADCLESMGDFKEALLCMREYSTLRERLLSESTEREFAILDLRYRVAEEQRLNATQKLALLRQRHHMAIIVGVSLLLAVVVAGLWVYHRKRMADYKAIVRGYLDNLEQERRLRDEYEERGRILPASSPGVSPGSGQGSGKCELFEALERLMKEQKAYRSSDFSLEKAASLLSTNRTYLSQVVNERGMSFTEYVNRYRLKEAIAILSDPSNKDPLKSISSSVGFTSPSTFYTLFRKKVGMSPSTFRNNVLTISEDRPDQWNPSSQHS